MVNMAVCPNWSDYYRRRKFEVVELPFRSFEDADGADYILRAVYELNANIYIPNYQEIPHSIIPELSETGVASILIANASYTEYLAEIVPYARYAKRFVGVSRTICRQLQEMSEVPPEQVRYIPYGVRTACSFPRSTLLPNAPLRIIYAGRMEVENKQVWRYLELARRLSDRCLDFHMTLLGDGPEYQAMAECVAGSAELHKCVTIPGAVSPEAVPSVLLEHDIFVLLSDTEGMPLSLLEAMGHGLVPVTSNIPSGIAEIVQNGNNGYLTPVGDIEAAAATIETLYHDPDLRAAIACRAYETTSDSFSISLMARRYAAMFNEVTAA